jgi:hypothetical protein
VPWLKFAPGFPVPDAMCFGWQREWLLNARAEVEQIWGEPIGSQIRFSVSEWSGGSYHATGPSWAGFGTGAMPRYVTGYLNVLREDGRDTGSGTGYWSASLFELAPNLQGNGYNLIEPDGSASDYYPAYKAASLSGQ